MTVQDLENRFIKFLDESHFIGYADQLSFDDEKKYYRLMREYFVKINAEKEESDPWAAEKIANGVRESKFIGYRELSRV